MTLKAQVIGTEIVQDCGKVVKVLTPNVCLMQPTTLIKGVCPTCNKLIRTDDISEYKICPDCKTELNWF